MAKFESQRVVPKTANYTISPSVDKNNTLFTNEGAAGTVIFTLPTPTRALFGQGYEFLGIAAAQILRVAGAAATDIVTVGSTAAASVSGPAATGARIIARCIRTSSSGNGTYKWYVSGTNGQTYTVV